mmetsp:Transcript_83455/g.174649  ORF Transcript_83455/g.174649 Transcript_83455/m.174649 type:complete len:116 (-) Transcript_83455:985-1332(-)
METGAISGGGGTGGAEEDDGNASAPGVKVYVSLLGSVLLADGSSNWKGAFGQLGTLLAVEGMLKYPSFLGDAASSPAEWNLFCSPSGAVFTSSLDSDSIESKLDKCVIDIVELSP